MGKPILRYEAGQTAYPFEQLANSGNDMYYAGSVSPWSNAAGAEPVVGVYGLMTGGAITGTGTNNQVAVAAATVMMPGAVGAAADGTLVVSGNVTVADADGTPAHIITSIVVGADGNLAAAPGTAGAAFTETRGVAGGPPWIAPGAIEIGQVRRAAAAPALIVSGEIFQVPGLHVERSDYPVYDVDYARGWVVFSEALPLIHDGGTKTKMVWARFATPLFSPIPKASDWVPAESTYSITSTDTYDGPVGSESASLGQASFTAQLSDGITEPFISQRGKRIWVEFRPDRDRSYPRQLTQGVLGVSRTNPASGNPTASCTLTPAVETLDQVTV
jgi:hypothetical protein